MGALKTPKQMERHLKGMSNHYRIEILLTVGVQSGITLEGLAKTLQADERTIGEHTRRLFTAGLLNKRHSGRYVEHSLSPYGRTFVQFLKAFQRA